MAIKNGTGRATAGEKLYSTKDLIEMLGLCQATIYKYYESGKLKSCKIGNARRVSESQLQEFLDTWSK